MIPNLLIDPILLSLVAILLTSLAIVLANVANVVKWRSAILLILTSIVLAALYGTISLVEQHIITGEFAMKLLSTKNAWVDFLGKDLLSAGWITFAAMALAIRFSGAKKGRLPKLWKILAFLAACCFALKIVTLFRPLVT